jgi:glycerol-3-phosphate dehydrogenase
VAVTGLSPDDGRPVFAIPHPEGTLVGTTDIFHGGGLDDPRPTADESGYLLRFAQHLFPGARLVESDVVGAFAGVRPILDSSADSPSAASREEAVWEEDGLLSTAGGKLTTYRATAEKVVSAALKLLPEERREAASPPATATVALPWRAAPAEVKAALVRAELSEPVAKGLTRRLGSTALPLAVAAHPEHLAPLADGLDICAAELLWHLRYGGVVHLEDLLLRRTRLGMWRPKLCLELVPTLRSPLRRAAGWSVKRWTTEVARLARAVANWLPPEAA